MRIVFTGGGSGGHVFPLIAVARQLKKSLAEKKTRANDGNGQLTMYFLGTGALDEQIFSQEGIQVKKIITGKFRRYFSPLNFVDIFKVPVGFAQSLWYLWLWMPDAIFSKGGYDSVPVVFAGWLYRIPILTHDSDVAPGLANRVTAPFATRIAVSFHEAEKHFPEAKTALIGNPIRQELVDKCTDTNARDWARRTLQVKGEKPIILVWGGSQGAKKINDMVLASVSELVKDYEIIHQCGKTQFEIVKHYFGQKPMPAGYYPFPFLDETQVAAAYLAADLIISRAGAGHIFETAICGKPSILIPLSGAASDHQRLNAYAYARSGAAVVIEENNLTIHLFLNQIKKILNDPELTKRLAQNARAFSRPDAARRLAQSLIELGE